MEDKKIDLNAPLLSVRRFHSAISAKGGGGGGGAEEEKQQQKQPQVVVVADGPVTTRSWLPFYKSDLKSGPVRDSGVVPFVWEQSPGRPKDDSGDGHVDIPSVPPKLPPGQRSGGGAVSSSGERLENGKDVVLMEKRSSEQVIMVDGRSGGDDEEEDAFSDALETLSRAESCFMNCSVSGMTGVGETTAATGHSGSCFSTDPQVRDFMMGRFLPAAQAMTTATGPPRTTRKAAAAAVTPSRRVENGGPRRPLPLPYQSQPKNILRYPPPNQAGGVESDEDEDDDDDDNDDDDDYDTRQLAMKGCGLLLPKFCLKGSFGVMNSVPGVKVKGRAYGPSSQRFRPAIKASTPQRSTAEPELEQTWEAMYRYKLGHGLQQMQGEDGSKLTTESHPLTFWSNSQSPDGSSPYRRSTGGGISPHRNESVQSPFHEGKGFLGVPVGGDGEIGKVDSFVSSRKVSDRYRELRPHLRSKSGSGSASPAMEKTLYIDSVHKLETSKSRSSSMDSKILFPADKDSDIAAESGRMEENTILEACEERKFQDEIPEAVETDVTFLADGFSVGGEIEGREKSREEVSVDSSETMKSEDRGKDDSNTIQPLFPPLPKSPSESWLWRTLPAVSSKSPTPQTFLGMRLNTKKKTIQKSTADPTVRTIVKTSKVHNSQMCFSEVLAKPVNED